MEQKSLMIRFTGKNELEIYEWLRRESFETGLAMAEICRRGLELYKESTREMTESRLK